MDSLIRPSPSAEHPGAWWPDDYDQDRLILELDDFEIRTVRSILDQVHRGVAPWMFLA